MAVGVTVPPALAAVGTNAGDLDATFGTNGVTTLAAPSGSFTVSGFQNGGVAVDSSGRVLLAGGDAGGGGNSVLTRFNADGSPDTTFDSGSASIETDVSGNGTADRYTAVGVNATTGNIYTVSQEGDLNSGTSNAVVTERDSAGNQLASLTLDGSLGLTNVTADSLIVQPDGTVLVSGSQQGFAELFVARLTSDLHFDPTFGSSGVAFVNFGARTVAYALAVQQDDNKIVAAASVRTGNDNSGVARLNPDGTLDTGFGNGGTVIFDAGQGQNEQAASLAISPDGTRIALGGNYDPSTQYVAMLTSAGALDSTFASGTGIYRGVSGDTMWQQALAWDNAGNIDIAYAGLQGTSVKRLNGTTGVPDATFGANGVGSAGCSNNDDVAGILRINGRIVVPGRCGADMMVAGFRENPATTVSNVTVSLTNSGVTTFALLDSPNAGPTAGAGREEVDLANLDPSKLSDGLAALQAAPLRGSPLRGSPLRGSPLRGSPLRGSPLRGSPLEESPLRGSPLRGSAFPVPIPLSTIPLLQDSGSDPTWATVLAGTQYDGLPLQSVTLQQVLALDPLPSAIAGLSLAQVDLSATPLRGSSFTSMFLWGVPLASLPAPSGGWCSFLAGQAASCSSATPVDPTTWDLLDLEMAGDNLSAYYAQPLQLAGVPLRGSGYSSPLANVYLTDVQLDVTPLGALAADLPGMSALLTCGTSCPSTLGAAQDAASGNISPSATVGDVISLLPQGTQVSLGQLLAGLINTADLPVESMPLANLLQQAQLRTDQDFHHTLSFDRNCMVAGNPASVDVQLTGGSRIVPSSVTLSADNNTLSAPTPQTLTSDTSSFTLPNVCPNSTSVVHVDLGFDVEPPVVLGAFTATDTLHATDGDVTASASGTTIDGRDATDDNPQTPNPLEPDVLYTGHISHPGDIDYWHLAAPSAGSTVTISLSHLPADYDLVVYGATADVPSTPLRGSPLRGSPLRGSPVGDTSGSDTNGDVVAPEGLADVPLRGSPLRGSSINRGTTDESVTMVVRSSDETKGFDVQVSGFNGASSPEPYALRVQETPGPQELSCPAVNLTLPAPGQAPGTPSASTQTLILVNQQRMAALYGANDTATMMSGLATLAARPDVQGLVVPVDSDASVRAAYAAWDQSPCSPDQANAVVSEINALVDTIRPNTPNLRHVVLVGGDNAIPSGRLPDLTSVDNQVSYTDQVRYRNNDNPISRAFLDGYILSDDPYGDFDPQPWLSGSLYVPDVGMGRLVETSADVTKAVDAYIAANGVLNPSSAYVTGYDFLSDAATSIAGSASRLGSVSSQINDTWTASQAATGINGITGNGLVSVNAHYDHYEALPADSFTAGTVNNLLNTSQLSASKTGTIMFTIGCEGGLNVPDTFVSGPTTDEAASLADWPQTATTKGAVYTGNTGYGYGDTDAIAYSERVYSYYAANIATKAMTVGQALMFAKQQYAGELGVAGVYDAKALEEAVTYGLPMYRIGSGGGLGAVALPPLPSGAVSGTATTQPLNLGSIQTTAVTDLHGTHWEVPGQAPQVTQGRPIEPRMTLAYPQTGDQRVHGVVIEGMTSTDTSNVDPAYSTPTVDLSANEPERNSQQAVFPAAIQAVNHTATASGPVDNVVIMPGQFFADPNGDGKGTQRLFSALSGTIYTSNSTDFDAPNIAGVQSWVDAAGGHVAVTTDATDVTRGVVLYRDNTSQTWKKAELSTGDTTLTATLPVGFGASEITDLTVQLVDSAGNVGISTNKGTGYTGTVNSGSIVATTMPVQPASGWFTGPVTVSFASASPLTVNVNDGGAKDYTSPVMLNGEGVNRVVATAADGTEQVVVVQIDSKVPLITGLTDGQTLLQGSAVTVACNDPAPGSGVATCAGAGAVDTSTIGTFTRQVRAVDVAGNDTGLLTLHYSVVAFAGFYQPVTNGAMNSVKGGRTVPIKFNVTQANNTQLTDPAQLVVRTYPVSCIASASDSSVTDTTTASTGLRWDSTAQQFVYNYKTPSSPGTCAAVSISYQSTVLAVATFKFT